MKSVDMKHTVREEAVGSVWWDAIPTVFVKLLS